MFYSCYITRNIVPKQGNYVWFCRISFLKNGKLKKVRSNFKSNFSFWFSPTVSKRVFVVFYCHFNLRWSPSPSVFAPPLLSYHICIRTLIPSISSVFILKSTPVKKKIQIRLRKPCSLEEPENEHHLHFPPHIWLLVFLEAASYADRHPPSLAAFTGATLSLCYHRRRTS